MKVYIVTEIYPNYSQTSWRVTAVFATSERAEDYIAKMATLPGIDREYAAGSENEYDVVEMDVWDEPTERIMLFHKTEYIHPDGSYDRPDHVYRTEEYAPPGYEGYWAETVDPPDWGGEVRSPGWGEIRVTGPSRENVIERFTRLVRQYWPALDARD